jgi:hypothetical protein
MAETTNPERDTKGAEGQASSQVSSKAPLVWEDPAPLYRRVGDQRICWMDRLAPLVDRPGRWARVLTATKRDVISYYAAGIKRNGRWAGRTSHLVIPPGRWEAAGRRIFEGQDQGKFGLYVRYVGPAEPIQ